MEASKRARCEDGAVLIIGFQLVRSSPEVTWQAHAHERAGHLAIRSCCDRLLNEGHFPW